MKLAKESQDVRMRLSSWELIPIRNGSSAICRRRNDGMVTRWLGKSSGLCNTWNHWWHFIYICAEVGLVFYCNVAQLSFTSGLPSVGLHLQMLWYSPQLYGKFLERVIKTLNDVCTQYLKSFPNPVLLSVNDDLHKIPHPVRPGTFGCPAVANLPRLGLSTFCVDSAVATLQHLARSLAD